MSRVNTEVQGAYLFDDMRLRQGYHLNMFCMSLGRKENRERFKQGDESWVERFPMTPAQRDAVQARDWMQLLDLGGNIHCLLKLAACDGTSARQVAASTAACTDDEYEAMMLAGGRCVELDKAMAGKDG